MYTLTDQQIDTVDTTSDNANDIMKNGAGSAGNPNYIPANEAYNDAISADPSIEQTTKDALKAANAAVISTLQPTTSGALASLNISFTGGTSLLSIVHNAPSARSALVFYHGSAFVDTNDTSVQYYLQVNGAARPEYYKFYFNSGSTHHHLTGIWSVPLNAGANTIALYMRRTAGLGNVIVNADDYVALNVLG